MMTKAASFRRAERLIHPQEFRKVLRQGAVVKKNAMALYYLRNDLEFSRLGIIVSRKAIRRAVDRNRMKRVVRELFRTQKKNFKTSCDLVFRAEYEFKTE